MLDSAEVSSALAWSPDWLMRMVSYAFGVVVGTWYGGYVSGYESSHLEYCEEREGEMGVDLREVPRVFPLGDGKMVLGGKCCSGLVRRMLRLFQRGTSTGIANVSSQTVHAQKYSSMTVLLHF